LKTSSTAKGTPVEELSINILNTHFENFSKATLENAKSRIIDVLGCGVGVLRPPAIQH
jgi:2-methylcitrate dehydratase PrpD